MKITEAKLKSIVQSVIREAAVGRHVDALKDEFLTELNELVGIVGWGEEDFTKDPRWATTHDRMVSVGKALMETMLSDIIDDAAAQPGGKYPNLHEYGIESNAIMDSFLD